MQFTKDTSKVLASIYKIYLDRRKDGQSKEEAIRFNEDFYKDVKVLSTWLNSDISSAIHELSDAKFIKPNIIGGFRIENTLIIQMENRFKSGASEVAKYIMDLIANTASGLVF